MKSISPFRRLLILGSAVTLVLALLAGTNSGESKESRPVGNDTRVDTATVTNTTGHGTAMFGLQALAQTSYTWQITCNADATVPGVGTGVNWVWLHNGVQISLDPQWVGFAACVSTPLSGSGVVPDTINGIQVNGIQVTLSLSEFPALCDAFASVTKSVDPSNPKFSINDNVSAPSNNGYKLLPAKCGVPGASFRFNISTN